jgi:pimeloyl-ACP methyl ester carboxylesterase
MSGLYFPISTIHYGALGACILLGLAVAWIGWFVLTRGATLLFCKPDETGDPDKGLVIFVESIRWLSIPWGRRSCLAGLRKAGYRGEFRYWWWHGFWRAWLVLPAIMDHAMLERQARRLADCIVEEQRAKPDKPIRLMGYSCGGYVATRALELLPGDIQVESVALLAAAISPWRDLRPACNHVRGPLIISSCWLDAVILGLGTLLFGTGDRVHTVSQGMVGHHGSKGRNVVELHWRPGMIHTGNVGGHFAAAATNYIAQLVAPMMGIGLEIH